MARFNLFGDAAFAGGAVASTNTSRGFEFIAEATCSIVGYRYWRPASGANTLAGTHTGYLWNTTTATELTAARIAFTNDPATEGWREQLLAAPVALTVGQKYRATVLFPTNHPQQSPFWTADVVSGPIRAYSSTNATGGTQGKNGNGTAYPTAGSGSQAHYGVDIIVDTPSTVRPGAFLPFFA